MRRKRVLALSLMVAATALGGCNGNETDEWTQNEVFQRMQRQPKYRYYQRNDFFADQRAMRPPVEGTVSRENYLAHQLGSGRNPDGTFVETIPFQVDMKTLELGRKQFQIVCAACHGLAGDGQGLVATNMSEAPPVSFHSEKLKNKADGYIYTVAGEGYGYMPPFAWRLTPKERWAIVAYIRALQYSQAVPLAEAPAEVKAQLAKEGR